MSIKLMAMNATELRAAIIEEMERNPALEMESEGVLLDGPLEGVAEGVDVETENLEYSDSSLYSGQQKGSDSNQLFLEGVLTRSESLYDYLSKQLDFLDLEERCAELCGRIIGNLDGDGFHREEVGLLMEGMEAGWKRGVEADGGLLEEALGIVRALDPVGCGCSDWRESLVVQAGIRGDGPPGFDSFVMELSPGSWSGKGVSGCLGEVPGEDWEDYHDYIKSLNPFPGRLYSNEDIHYIVPELEVRIHEGELKLIFNDDIFPVLTLDTEFERLRRESGDKREVRKVFADYVRDARYFINSLAQRDSTLLKVARVVVEFQRDFFFQGPKYLRPLTLRDVAREIDMHEATVSRITTGKYVHTDWGMYELKYFFTNSISGAGSGGSRVSKTAAKEILKEIISTLKPGDRVSDEKMSQMLAGRGIKLARRTVAKYRRELDLPSVYDR